MNGYAKKDIALLVQRPNQWPPWQNSNLKKLVEYICVLSFFPMRRRSPIRNVSYGLMGERIHGKTNPLRTLSSLSIDKD